MYRTTAIIAVTLFVIYLYVRQCDNNIILRVYNNNSDSGGVRPRLITINARAAFKAKLWLKSKGLLAARQRGPFRRHFLERLSHYCSIGKGGFSRSLWIIYLPFYGPPGDRETVVFSLYVTLKDSVGKIVPVNWLS